MPDELNTNMLDVQDDDPNAPDDQPAPLPKSTPKPIVKPSANGSVADEGDGEDDDFDIAAALNEKAPLAETKSASQGEVKPPDSPEGKPAAEAAAVEGATGQESPKPAIDIEAELEKRLQAKLAEVEQRHQQEKQRAIDAVVAKERKRDESAVRKLRDLQAATGMDVDKLLETNRARQIEHLQVEQGLTEQAARELVAAREKAALYEAREAERVHEHEESVKTAEYRAQKLDFIADAKQANIYKKALQKYGDEVDSFSDSGKQVNFEVALRYVAGQHLPEIVAELNAEAEAKLAAKNAEIETRTKAAEQAAIRNIQQRGKAAPETSSAGTPQKETLPRETSRMATYFDLDPRDVAKTKAAKQNRRN